MMKTDYRFVVTVRFPEEKREIIHRAAQIDGTSLSTFMRRAAFKELVRMHLLSGEEATAYTEG